MLRYIGSYAARYASRCGLFCNITQVRPPINEENTPRCTRVITVTLPCIVASRKCLRTTSGQRDGEWSSPGATDFIFPILGVTLPIKSGHRKYRGSKFPSCS
jgi:hypothetical protein